MVQIKKHAIFQVEHVVTSAFCLLALADILWTFHFSSREKIIWNFVGNFLLLNTIHITFTFAILLTTNQGRHWFSEKLRARRLLLVEWTLVFLGAFMLHLSLAKLAGLWLAFALLFLFFYKTYHSLKQHFGISLLFNYQKAKTHPHNALLLKKSEPFERRVVTLVIFSCCAWFSTKAFPQLFGLVAWANALLALATLGVLVLILRVGQSTLTKRLLMLRYLLYPLGCFSFLGLVGASGVHGLEYYRVFLNARENNSSSTGITRLAMVGAIGLFSLVMLLAIINSKSGVVAIYRGKEVGGFWNDMTRITISSIAYLHYYIDGQLFKMKDPVVRNYILPLVRSV